MEVFRMTQFLFSAISFLGLLAPCPAADERPRVTAPQLVETFYSNAAAVEEYYLEKEIIVTGKFRWVTRDHSPQTVDIEKDSFYAMEMDLESAGKSTGLTLVLVFDQSHRKKLADLKQKDYVTVSGTCKRSGRSVTIEVVDCKLVASK
jgi:hypothetical protein